VTNGRHLPLVEVELGEPIFGHLTNKRAGGICIATTLIESQKHHPGKLTTDYRPQTTDFRFCFLTSDF
jgi:hypothetical protein